MKQGISKFTLTAILIITCLQGISQANKKSSFSINFGPEVVFPETFLNNTHQLGFGGSFKGEYTFGKHASVTINTGLLVIRGRNYFDDVVLQRRKYENLTAIPVKAGLRYYIGNFYISGEAGIVFLQDYINTTRPIASIGLGDKIRLGSGKLDISLRQEFWISSTSNLNLAVLRAAYEIVW